MRYVIGMALLMIAISLGAIADYPAAHVCQEDEALVATDYRTPGAIEDARGVHRICVNWESYVAPLEVQGCVIDQVLVDGKPRLTYGC